MMTTPFFALVAIPLTLVVIVKEMDLSFTSVMAWGVAAYDIYLCGNPNVWLGFIACLLAGLVAGLLNGLIVVRLGIPSLVATIGTQFLWRGVVLVVTNGQGRAWRGQEHHPVSVAGRQDWAHIPMPFIWTIIFALIAWFFLNHHKFGAHVYLTGDNVDSARLMGVNSAAHQNHDLCAGRLGGRLCRFYGQRTAFIFWPTLGDGYLLNTLASVFLGGTSYLAARAPSMEPLSRLSSSLSSTRALSPRVGLAYWTQLIYGFIIVASVALQAVLRRRFS